MAFTRNTEAGAPATMPATASNGAPAFRRSAQMQTSDTSGGMRLFEYAVGDEEIRLTVEDIKTYFCPKATDKECITFGYLCKANGLNPWVRDAYLIKYSESEPPTMVVGRDAYAKRAEACPAYDGTESGVVVYNSNAQTIEHREGSAYYPDMGDQLIGGWAKVYRKDRSRPQYIEVALNEYLGKKKSGEVTSMWLTKPGTMICKVAESQALRKAFPLNVQGMYDESEVPFDADVEGSFQDVSNRPRPGEALRAHQQRAKALREAATAAKASQESDDPFAIPADAIEEDGDPA